MNDPTSIQEESPMKPILVLRTETENPERVIDGMGKIVGVEKHVIITEAMKVLTDTYI